MAMMCWMASRRGTAGALTERPAPHGPHLEVVRLKGMTSRSQRYSARVRASVPLDACRVIKTPTQSADAILRGGQRKVPSTPL